MNIISTKLPFKGVMTSFIGGRKENQDTCGYSETPRGLLLVVCDGMGGGPGGKTASSIAAATIIGYIKQVQSLSDNSAINNETLVRDAVIAANKALRDKIIETPELNGMGTTVTALLLSAESATVAHVGDSRIYQLRQRKIVFRTADHSRVGEMVQAGVLTEEQARLSAISNLITRALGIGDEVNVDVCEIPYQRGDRFVLCTDGVWGSMPQDDLVRSFCDNNAIENTAEILNLKVEQAGRDKGGHHDNYTMIMVDTENSSNEVQPAKVDLMNPQIASETQVKKGKPKFDTRILALIITGIIITPAIVFALININWHVQPVLDNNVVEDITDSSDNNSGCEELPENETEATVIAPSTAATATDKAIEPRSKSASTDDTPQSTTKTDAVEPDDSKDEKAIETNTTDTSVTESTANKEDLVKELDTLNYIKNKLDALRRNIESMQANAQRSAPKAKENYESQKQGAINILNDLKKKNVFDQNDRDLLFRALLAKDARSDGNKPNGILGIIGNENPDFDRMLKNVNAVIPKIDAKIEQISNQINQPE